MTASSTLRGKNSTPLARLIEMITRLTLPNVIGDDQPRANETQQLCQQWVPIRQEQGLNVNNVRVQTVPEGGGYSPPRQRYQPNDNNDWVQFDPDGGEFTY